MTTAAKGRAAHGQALVLAAFAEVILAGSVNCGINIGDRLQVRPRLGLEIGGRLQVRPRLELGDRGQTSSLSPLASWEQEFPISPR